jgi:hypothetical protein
LLRLRFAWTTQDTHRTRRLDRRRIAPPVQSSRYLGSLTARIAANPNSVECQTLMRLGTAYVHVLGFGPISKSFPLWIELRSPSSPLFAGQRHSSLGSRVDRRLRQLTTYCLSARFTNSGGPKSGRCQIAGIRQGRTWLIAWALALTMLFDERRTARI